MAIDGDGEELEELKGHGLFVSSRAYMEQLDKGKPPNNQIFRQNRKTPLMKHNMLCVATEIVTFEFLCSASQLPQSNCPSDNTTDQLLQNHTALPESLLLLLFLLTTRFYIPNSSLASDNSHSKAGNQLHGRHRYSSSPTPETPPTTAQRATVYWAPQREDSSSSSMESATKNNIYKN
jgi:hypothetical protein